MQDNLCVKLQELLGLRRPHPDYPETKATFVVARTSGKSNPGKLTTVRLYSSTQIDHDTGKGKICEEANIKGGKNTKHGAINTVTYRLSFYLEDGFGTPGAIAVKNGDKQEFFLKFVKIEMRNGEHVHFDCNSWVYPYKKTNTDRIFFSNTSYLPKQTPEALRELRKEELVSLRGTDRGERKPWERVYEYDHYNDLSNPDKGQQHSRPVLGGSHTYPYPRRGRTGRPLSDKDRVTETRNKIIDLDFYVPPDERFSPNKLSEFIRNSIQAVVHFVIPEVKSLFEADHNKFESFDQMVKDLYSGGRRGRALEGLVMEKLKGLLPEELFKEVVRGTKENSLKFPLPQIIASDQSAWKNDEEFGRQMLAGINPAVIKRLVNFPPVGKGGRQSSITASHIEKLLDRLSVDDAMNQWRIFILDHHDYLMPYLRRINAEGVCMYASRTLLFLKQDATLKPIAIELSLPGNKEGEEISRVFTPATEGTEGALWQLAKAHVAANDSGHHQLISHWLHTHAAVEPFIIATRRQLSAMHPIHKLLEPHFKDTMHINALARSILLNAGGILEKTMFPGKYSLELSSSIYEDWRFDQQGLPADLIKRGFAFEDPDEPSGTHILFDDYPYGLDGLDVWTAIKTWVSDYCKIFYPDDEAVINDLEIQAWWTEIRRVGHGDRQEGWYEMDSISHLTEALTTLIWIASALHASVNFGQYAYAGFPPNRPTKFHKFIPSEGTPEFAMFIENPDKYFLEMIPDRLTTTLGVALVEVLSRHTGDELYIGQRGSTEWTNNDQVLKLFKKFGDDLRKVERTINARNNDPDLKNRRGPAMIPYTLLNPDTSNTGSEKGITGKGIPNSVSI
ncbi:Linoleate 9S-lipoxygenase protein [Dioscorea alata]|uniref:Linoleate 9S-lipoxygenase protein n=1 Tax=Dioscorea alata TaxID=55571 RepID=A0ACB7W1J6_DIOAL|nr:Linoleate 9S-lipoxygenase protein [Dioscorea alata]